MTEGEAAAAKPRLLVLTSTYPRWQGDPEPGFVHELSRRLAAWFEVLVLCPHAPHARVHEQLDGVQVVRFRYAPARLETLVNDGGIVTNLRRQRWKALLLPAFLIAQWWAARRLLRNWRPAVVHAHWLVPQGLVAATAGGRCASLLVTSHGADLFALRDPLTRALKRFVARRAAALTVVSSAMLDELDRQGIDRSRAEVLPMGVDLAQTFHPIDAIARSPHRLLFVGRLVEKKGLRHLLDALFILIRRFPDAELLIAGFGPERAALETQVATLGLKEHVEFLGPVAQEKLPALYSSAKVFVAPFVTAQGGDQEGLGLVAIEAAACGASLVLGNVPATADFEGLAPGIVRVDARDAEQLAAALAESLSKPEDVGAASALRARMLERFDWSHVAERYARLLHGVAAAPGAAT